jgi:hypothetical protein
MFKRVVNPLVAIAIRIKTKNPVNVKFTGYCINLHDIFVENRGIEPLTL